MIHKLFLFIFLSWNFANAKVTELFLSHPKERNTYRIGEEVLLTCMIEDPADLSVLFRHRDKNMAENGISYSSEFIVTGSPDKNSNYKESNKKYTLLIKKLRWDNHGLWECVHGESMKDVSITITVPGVVEAIKSELEPGRIDKKPLTEMNNPLPQIIYGKGIKTNPFDLTRNTRLMLHCKTGCSNPQSHHNWVYSNITMFNRIINATHTSTSTCSLSDAGDGYYTESTILIGCNEPQMVGSNEITCKMIDYKDSQSVYVLCPGGHKPLTLTNGEIIGLSIAFALAALMLVLFFMSAKKIINSYRYGSVVGGIRV